MLIKTKKAARKYVVVGYDTYGAPLRKLSKEPELKECTEKIQQTCVIGGEVVGLVKYSELYYNNYNLPIYTLKVGTFLEIPEEIAELLMDKRAMSTYFPSYISVDL